MGAFVARTKAEPADNLASRMLTSGELTDDEVTNILLLLFVAGYVTTEGALAMSVFALLCHPDQLAALRAGGDFAGVVDELLRYTTVNQYEIFRAATEDVELGGELVRAGETVTLSLPSANRDPRRFPNPTALDLGRDPAGHLAFGHGVHQCLGQHLGRAVLEIALATLLPALPGLALAVPEAEVPLRARTSVFSVGSLPVTW